jgi:hypothetical protein
MKITIDGTPEELSQLALRLASEGLSLAPAPYTQPEEKGPEEAPEGLAASILWYDTRGWARILRTGDPIPVEWGPEEVVKYCSGRKLRAGFMEDGEWFMPSHEDSDGLVWGEDNYGGVDYWGFGVGRGPWTLLE